MKTPDPAEPADPLRPILQRWEVRSALPARFETRVWQRIRAAEAEPMPFYMALATWIEQTLRRPALAVAYVAILLALGLTLGDWQGHRQSARAESAARQLYVQAVDPYQAVLR
ncbi:MAG: hypothetical protein KGS61_18895 [Verrucomicrobia bacterium]|nr:hypothetical protein [Verrucomicrobiota bacterium]